MNNREYSTLYILAVFTVIALALCSFQAQAQGLAGIVLDIHQLMQMQHLRSKSAAGQHPVPLRNPERFYQLPEQELLEPENSTDAVLPRFIEDNLFPEVELPQSELNNPVLVFNNKFSDFWWFGIDDESVGLITTPSGYVCGLQPAGAQCNHTDPMELFVSFDATLFSEKNTGVLSGAEYRTLRTSCHSAGLHVPAVRASL